MERSYITENDAERTRLKVLVAGLSDADLACPIRPGWTVGVGLAHLAFWDRLWLAKFEEAERTGTFNLIPGTASQFNAMNDGMLIWFQNIAPAQVKYEVVAAAEAIDIKATGLPDWLVEEILAKRPRTLIRAVHRREHLGEIDRALKG